MTPVRSAFLGCLCVLAVSLPPLARAGQSCAAICAMPIDETVVMTDEPQPAQHVRPAVPRPMPRLRAKPDAALDLIAGEAPEPDLPILYDD